MPKGVYERRKIKMDMTPAETKPYSQFLTDLSDSLMLRAQQIKDEINAIDNQMTTMQDNRVSLVDEQTKVEAGLKALKK